MELAVPVALLAGIVSFASPCFLLIVPVFVGQLVGFGPGRVDRRVALGNSPTFIAGFPIVFIALWVSLGLLGRSLGPHAVHAWILGGAVLVSMGLYVVGILRLPMLDGLVRGRLPIAGGTMFVWRARLMGVVFGTRWTPCIGPVLGGILTLATVSFTMWSEMLLMTAYCLGLGLPIVAVALGQAEVTRCFDRFARHHVAVSLVTGGFLVVINFLMTTNLFASLAGSIPVFGIQR